MLRRAWIACLVTISPAFTALECPSDFTEISYSHDDAKCIAVVTPDELRGLDACEIEACEPLGGTLWCPESADEDEAVYDWVKTQLSGNGDYALLGLYSCRSEGRWRWTSTCASTFRAWKEDEPSNNGGDADCAGVRKKKKGWEDVACDGNHKCICEYGTERAASYEKNQCKCSAVWVGVESCGAAITIVWSVWAVITAVALGTVAFDRWTSEGPPEGAPAYGGLTTRQLRDNAELAMTMMVSNIFLWSLAYSIFNSAFSLFVFILNFFLTFAFIATYMYLFAKLYSSYCKGICFGLPVFITPLMFIGLGNYGVILGWSLYMVPVAWIHIQMKRKALMGSHQALHPTADGIQLPSIQLATFPTPARAAAAGEEYSYPQATSTRIVGIQEHDEKSTSGTLGVLLGQEDSVGGAGGEIVRRSGHGQAAAAAAAAAAATAAAAPAYKQRS
jgi:hypothetical protein